MPEMHFLFDLLAAREMAACIGLPVRDLRRGHGCFTAEAGFVASLLVGWGGGDDHDMHLCIFPAINVEPISAHPQPLRESMRKIALGSVPDPQD